MMSGKRLSATVRGEIMEAAAWQPLRTVALRFQCSHTTVSRLVRLKEAGRPELPPKHAGGRPKTISDQARAHIRQTLLANRWQSPSQIARTLQANGQGVMVSISTIKRQMKKEGLRRYVARRKPHLSAAAKAIRLSYAKEHLEDDLDT